MLERLFKQKCKIKRPVTVGTLRNKKGKFNLDDGTDALIKSIAITQQEMTFFSLTINNSAFLIKGVDSIPDGSELVYDEKTYSLSKIKVLRNIHDKLEGFKVFV